jgi:hypothetical protein
MPKDSGRMTLKIFEVVILITGPECWSLEGKGVLREESRAVLQPGGLLPRAASSLCSPHSDTALLGHPTCRAAQVFALGECKL